MAINPYTQRTGVPANAGGGVPTAVSTQVTDIGPAIQRLGAQVMQSQMPRLEQEAIKRGQEDFAAYHKGELGKDENGNYVLIEPMEGGGALYTAAYEKAGQNRLVIETMNDTEAYLNELYLDKDRYKRDPSEVRQEAMDYVRGVIAGSPPAIRDALLEQMSREVKQRDLQASNEAMRIAREQELNTFEAKRTDLIERIGNVAQLPQTEQSAIELEKLQGELDGITADLVLIKGEGEAIASARELANVLGFAGVMREFNANEASVSAMDIDEFAAIIEGAEGSAFGMDYASIVQMVPDQRTRNQLAAEVRQRAVLRSKQEAGRAAAAADEEGYQQSLGTGRSFDQSPKEYSEAVLAWANDNQVDLNTPQGMMRAAEAFGGDLPDAYYKFQMEGARGRTQDEIAANADLYQQMQNFPNPVDGTRKVVDIGLSTEDKAFYHHVNLARSNKKTLGEAIDVANKMIEQGWKFNRNDMVTEMTKRYGIEEREDFFDDLDDGIGTYSKLSVEARNWLVDSMAQQAVMGIDYKSALKNAQAEFARNFVQDKYAGGLVSVGTLRSVGNAIGVTSEAGNWVRSTAATPTAFNPQTRKNDRGWLEDPSLLSSISELAGTQRPGVPPVADMEIGKDLVFVAAGTQDSKKKGGRSSSSASASQLFYVYYQPGNGNFPTALQAKEGGPLVVDLGNAAFVRNAGAKEIYRQQNIEISDMYATDLNERATNPLLSYIAPGAAVIGNMVDAVGRQLNAVEIIGRENPLEVKPKHIEVKRKEVAVGMAGGGYSSLTDAVYQDYLRRVGPAESPNDWAKNPKSSATGRYQFLDDTWVSYYRKAHPKTKLSESQILAKRKDGKVQEVVMRAFTADNARVLQKAGIPIRNETLYGAHFFGAETFAKMMKGASLRDSIANWVKPEVIAVNPGLSYDRRGKKPKTIEHVYQWLAYKMRV